MYKVLLWVFSLYNSLVGLWHMSRPKSKYHWGVMKFTYCLYGKIYMAWKQVIVTLYKLLLCGTSRSLLTYVFIFVSSDEVTQLGGVKENVKCQ